MKRYEVRISSAADAMFLELELWWSENRPAAETQVVTEYERIIEVLATEPHRGQLYNHRRVTGIRRMALKKAPYHAYYEVDDEAGVVMIIALWSSVTKKGPPLHELI